MKTSFLNKFIVVLLWNFTQFGFAQGNPDVSSHVALDNYRSQIEEMESQLGRYDRRLLEPLSQLVESTISLSQFNETHAILDRAVQIHRINEGLYTESQLPLIRLMVENNMKRGYWKDANEDLEHLLWLYSNKHNDLDTDLVYELMGLSKLHLEAVVADDYRNQGHHLLLAADINFHAIRVAEAVWGPADHRLVSLYYELVKQYRLQTIAMEKGGQTSYDLREISPGSGWLRPRQTVKQVHYRSGNILLSRMREIFTESQPPDPEAAAMVDLYRGDWELLYTMSDSATNYAQAFDGLSRSGIDIDSLNSFFSQPVLLPVNEFHFSLDDAITTGAQTQAIAELSAEPAVSDNLLYFFEWSRALPNVQFPMSGNQLVRNEQQDWHVARLAFNLGALEKVTRWVNGRWVTNTGVPQQVEVLDADPGRPLDQEELDNRLHNLHFRPRIQDGKAQSSRTMLQYSYYSQ